VVTKAGLTVYDFPDVWLSTRKLVK